MKNRLIFIFLILLGYDCSGSKVYVKNYRLNLEFRTEDHKKISDIVHKT